LDKRDKDRSMADEAKNTYESQIYGLRAWLVDEDNHIYVTEEDREALLSKLEDGEEWLYDEGSQLGHTKYQDRSYELTTEMNKFNRRKDENSSRLTTVVKIREGLEESRSRAH